MEWLAVAGFVATVLLGATVAVLSVMLGIARRSSPGATTRRTDTDPAAPDVDPEKPSATDFVGEIRDDMYQRQIAGGEVILFRMNLENDRLSAVTLSGWTPPGCPTTIKFDAAIEKIRVDDRAMFRNAVIDAMTRERPLELVFRFGGSENEQFFHLRGVTSRDAGSESVELTGAITDVTSLMAAQRDQGEWLKTLEELQDTIPFGIWAFGSDGVMTIWNRAAEKLTGLPPESVVGFDRKSILNDTFHAIVRDPGESLPEGGTFRVQVTVANGPHQFRVTPVTISRNDRIVHRFGVFAEELPAARAGRSGELEALGRLTAGVAHDFANLVHIVMGYADIVAQDLRDNERLLPPYLMDDLGQIQSAATRADELVRQLLAFCARDSLSATRCDLNEVIKRFTGLMTRILGESIALRFHPRPDPGTAMTDPGLVEKAVIRLLLHAKETLPGGGVVAISTSHVAVDPEWPVGNLEPGDYVKLSISTDTVGWGREPGADTDGDANDDIARLMTSCGGFVNIHESPDLGTTVSLYFRSAGEQPSRVDPPRPPDSQPVDAAGDDDEPDAASQVPAARGTILVVEDDTPVRRLTAKALAMAGHVVLEAADGPEAIAQFNRDPERVDLLITDVIMPGMNGRQVCDELKRLRPDLPVLFCSGYSSDLLKNEYMLNIQGLVIQKPYRSADLVAAAARLLAASPARTVRAPGGAGNDTSM